MTGRQQRAIEFAALASMGAAMVSVPTPAHAYIDPASGSMILQLLMGGAASLWLVVKHFFSKKSK